MSDLISRQAAIDAIGALSDAVFKNIEKGATYPKRQWFDGMANAESIIEDLPSAQPEISRIERELHGKTPEEQYEFLYWLLLKFGLAYTDSRLAVIEWLRGEKEDVKVR